MVKAILAGTKIHTRRIVKPQPLTDNVRGPELYAPTIIDRHGEEQPGDYIYGIYDDSGEWGVKSPYGQTGDNLWVKETFFSTGRYQDEPKFAGAPEFIYRADYEYRDNERSVIDPYHWKPSIFCTRAASRITLEITGVRVERLQDISAADAIAEGIRVEKGSGMIEGEDCYMMTTNSGYMRGPAGAIAAYRNLWNSLNAKRGFGWDANPWVWVIEFRRINARHLAPPP